LDNQFDWTINTADYLDISWS